MLYLVFRNSLVFPKSLAYSILPPPHAVKGFFRQNRQKVDKFGVFRWTPFHLCDSMKLMGETTRVQGWEITQDDIMFGA